MAKQSSEDYLRCIYKLQTGEKEVQTSRIAIALGFTMPSVTDMLQKLAHDGLVEYKRYGGARLTKKGMRVAVDVTRRHRLWEMFLVRILNFTWDEVHDIANLLEHVTPPVLEERMDALLGYPTVDPHGEPIPTKEGVVAAQSEIPLSYLQANQSAIVSRAIDDPASLKQLSALGIALKKSIRIIGIAPIDGSMIVRIGNKEIFLPRELAAHIFVQLEGQVKTEKRKKGKGKM